MTDQPMRVVYCHPGAELYGSDRMAAATAAGLVDAGATVDAVLPGPGPLVGHFNAAGASTHLVATPVLRKSLMRPLPFLKLIASLPLSISRMLRLLKRADASLVFVNTITQPWWILAARLRRIPTAVHVREAEETVPRWVQKGLTAPLALADVVIANSAHTRDHLVSLMPSVESRVRVVYNGKAWEPYFRSPFVGFSEHPKVLFIGRLGPRKGPDVLIRAVQELNRKGVRVDLTLAGAVFPGYEWYEAELRELVTDLSLEQQVSFAGFRDDVTELLAEAELVVVPSRQEPFGTVAAEAMAAMRPTVVSRVQGLVEIVSDDSVGSVFESEDAVGLADACLALFNDPARARDIAEAGMARVRERFSLDAYRAGISDCVTAAVGRRVSR